MDRGGSTDREGTPDRPLGSRSSSSSDGAHPLSSDAIVEALEAKSSPGRSSLPSPSPSRSPSPHPLLEDAEKSEPVSGVRDRTEDLALLAAELKATKGDVQPSIPGPLALG